MGAVGVVGVLLGLAAGLFALVERTRVRAVVFFLAYILHLSATVASYLYVTSEGGDAGMYYYDPLNIYDGDFAFGTTAIVHIVQGLKEVFGGSLLDFFLLFQALGFWGIAVLMRTFEEVFIELQFPQLTLAYLLLFLPGLHFWPSSIGKDAPLFLAVALCVWAALSLTKRYPVVIAAVAIMVLVRPHIALITMISFALAILVDTRVRLFARIVLLAFAFAGAGFVASTVQTTFSVNVSDANSVSDFLAARSNVGEDSGGNIGLIQSSFPVKMISLLFRPLFFDAQSPLALIVSFENLAILLIILTLGRRFGTSVAIVKRVFFVRFSAIFFVSLAILLALVNFNVGLGLRQKMMMMPALLTVFVALLAVRASQKRGLSTVTPASSIPGVPAVGLLHARGSIER